MRHILQWIFVFAAALASVFTLQSCGLEEPFNTPQSSATEGVVELVARPVSYNNHEVSTKAAGDFNDAAIHNAFLILFNKDGQRILFEEINIADEQLSAKIDRGLSEVTACILANVPADFARGIIGTTKPEDGSANQYLNTAVLDLTYDSSKSGIIRVPVLDLDNNTSTPAVPCIPMCGQTDERLNLASANSVIEIDLKRLFAKVSVELTLDNQGQYDRTRFELTSYQLVNLPSKVSISPLSEDEDKESAWVSDNTSFEDAYTVNTQNYKIFNKSYALITDESQKKYSFEFYVPEYGLIPLTIDQYKNNDGTEETYGTQEYKPKMYDTDKNPIHIIIHGSYIPSAGSSSNLVYSVYLGEDASQSFTLNRNVHYKNYLTITGTTKNADNTNAALIDHRVKMSDGNMVSLFGEVANCYVISKEGEYSFPAYKGAFKANELSMDYLCKGSTAEITYRTNTTDIVFEDEDGDGNPIKVTTDVDGTKVIGFKLSKVNAEDNVIIAMYDSNGKIEWSWHLWFVTGLQLMGNNTGYFQMSTQAMPDANGKEMIDRNLGVVTSGVADNLAVGTSTGLYYKYGHRGPFISTKYWDDDDLPVDYSYAWAGKQDNKSRTDPCPPGYRVPYYDDEDNIWETGQGKTGTSQYYFFYSIADPNITYGYSGYLYKDSKDNQFKSNNSDSGEGEFDVENYTYHNPLNDRTSTTNETGGRWDRNKTRTKITHKTEYYNIKYYAKVKSTIGGFWCSGNKLFRYEYSTIDWSQITQNAFTLSYCKTRSYDVYQDQKSSNYGVTWSNVGNERIENEVLGEMKSNFPSLMPAAVFLEVNGIDLGQSDSRYISGNTEHGYQVRCVKE